MCTYNANHRTGLTSYYAFIYFVFVYFLMPRHVRKLQSLPVKKDRRSEKENRTFNPREMRITFERPSKERNACSFLKKILERTHTKICLSLRTLFAFPASQVVFSETAAQDGCTTLDILVKFFLARRSKSAWVIGWRVITGPPVFFCSLLVFVRVTLEGSFVPDTSDPVPSSLAPTCKDAIAFGWQWTISRTNCE